MIFYFLYPLVSFPYVWSLQTTAGPLADTEGHIKDLSPRVRIQGQLQPQLQGCDLDGTVSIRDALTEVINLAHVGWDATSEQTDNPEEAALLRTYFGPRTRNSYQLYHQMYRSMEFEARVTLDSVNTLRPFGTEEYNIHCHDVDRWEDHLSSYKNGSYVQEAKDMIDAVAGIEID